MNDAVRWTMSIRLIWRWRWPMVRWGLFVVVLTAVAAGLFFVLPPEPRWVLSLEPREVFEVEDGRFATCRLADGAAAGPVQLWDAATGQELESFLAEAGPFEARGRSADGRYFVGLTNSAKAATTLIWVVDLQERRAWRAEAAVGAFQSTTFSPRCDFVALRLPRAKEDAESYAVVETASGRVVEQVDIPGGADQVSFGSDGGCVAFGYGNGDDEDSHHIRALNTRTGKTTLLEDARLIGVSPDSQRLLAERHDHGVWLWDLAAARWDGPLEDVKAEPPALKQARWTNIVGMRMLWSATTGRRVRNVRVWSSVGRGIRWLRVHARSDSVPYFVDGRFLLWDAARSSNEIAFTIYDMNAMKKHWERTWVPPPRDPLHTPGGRRLVLVFSDQVEVVEVTTGETVSAFPLGATVDRHPELTRDGRTLVTSESPEEEPSHWIVEKVRDWILPRPDTAPMLISAIDLDSGQSLAAALVDETDAYWLTEDRQSLLTVYHEHDENRVIATTIRCWDMPPRKPLRFALGLPLGLAMISLSLWAGWRRLRRRSTAVRPKGPATATGTVPT
jgi:hypothetical protein